MTVMKPDEPLGLVVHSMPTAQLSASKGVAVTGYWKLLAIVLLCSLPAIVAYFVFYVVHPQGRAGFGELIQPVRPVPGGAATTLDGRAVPLSTLKGQWLLASVAGGACAADCQRRLYLQRQLRETLGKDKDRVDSVWLISDQAPVAEGTQPASSETLMLRIGQTDMNAWLLPATGQGLTDFIFVIDPLGNTMMRFPARFDPASAAKAKRDLERLLRASASWDSPGR